MLMRGKRRGLLLAATLVAAVASILMASAFGATTSISTFTKSGTDAATNSTADAGGPAGTTAANDVIDWVLSYRNNTTKTANVNVTDPITGNHNFVPGSLKTPPGLPPQWSTNGGASYMNSEPGSGVNAVGAAGTSIAGSTGAEAQASPPPPASTPGSGGGDGFEALFVGNNVYNVYHHTGGTSGASNRPVLDCHVRSTGAVCPGYPTYVSPNAGDNFGTGPSTLTTALHTNAAVVGSKIYYPVGVIGARTEGIACADVSMQKSCGFTQLGTYSASDAGPNPNASSATINGGTVVNSRYYTVGVHGDIYCYDLSSETQCPSIPRSVSDPTRTNALSHPYYSLDAWDDRYLFGTFRINTTGGPRDLICIDLTTNQSCPGFPKLGYGALSGGFHNSTLVPILNASGDVTGVCGVYTTTGTDHPFKCFDLTGNAVPTPFSETQTSGTVVNAYSFGSIEVIGSRIYFAETVQSTRRATYTCWDYAVTPSAPGKTGNVCPGFVAATSNQNLAPYTLRQDPQNPDCIWELGDSDRFEVFSATFGGIGCREGNASLDIEPADYYCDGQGGHVTAWDKIILGGITSSDYNGAAVTITDDNGDPVPGWQNKIITPAQGQTIDISSIPYSGSTTTLHISVAIEWGTKPVKPATVKATFVGDPVQVCFQTKVGQGSCTDAKTITNNAKAVTDAGVGSTDSPNGNPSGVVTFNQPADPTECKADLELEKTGDPPVVSQGGQVTYTLTVTNHGPNDSTGSTVTDTLPNGLTNIQSSTPGCQIQGQEVTCDVGPLANGDSTDIEITADAPNTPSTCFENTASVAGDQDDPVSGNDTSEPARICTTPAADLEISKSSTPQVVSQGGQVTYEIAVNNNGPDDAHNVVVTDTLPNGLTNIQAGPGCNVQGQVLTCNFALLQPNNPQILLVTANAPTTPSTCFDNVASVKADEGDPDLSNNESDPARSCTTPAADLAIFKSGPATVDAGGQVSYTLNVQNNGPDAAHNIVVTDDLPAGLTNVQAPGCSVQGQTVTCNVAFLGAVDEFNIQITADAPNAGSTCFDNAASVEADEGDPDTSDNTSDPVQTCTRLSDLELTKTVDPQLVDPGDPLTYTLTVTNHGPDQSSASTVTDNLPNGLSNVQVPQNCQLQGQQVTCNIAPLDADESTDIVITADAPNTAATCFSNDASVDASSDHNGSNDEASARACTTPAADLELEKTAPATVDPGGQVSWTLTVTNHGPHQSSGSTVTDNLPNGVTDIQVPQNCQLQGSAVTCDVGPLDPDDSVDIVITGDAPNTAENCFSNGAVVDIDDDAPDESDPNSDNNDASAQTCTNEGADLEVSKTADVGPHSAGDDVTYTITVTNHGPATAHNATIDDDLPDSLTFVSATPDQGTCNNGEPVSCNLGTIAPNASAHVTLVATIASDQSGKQIDNTACAEATEPDPQDNNDCGDETVDVEREADLSIVKTSDAAGPVLVGDTVTYTLAIHNDGPNDVADNVTVADQFQTEAKIVSVTPSQGSCQAADPITCDLGPMAAGADATVTVVVQPLHKGNLHNDATVDSLTPDPDPTDNGDDEDVTVKPVKLSIKKTAKQNKAEPGDVIDYEIEVRSKADVRLKNLRICDKVPKQLELVSAPGANVHGRTACWRFALPANGSRTFKVRARVKPTKYPLKVKNTAKVTGDDVKPARGRDGVAVKPDDDGRGPGPCPGAKRC